VLADIPLPRRPQEGISYGMEEDVRFQKELHDVLTKAVQLIARSQSGAGGWLYSPDSNGDEGSVTVTQIQALRACRNSGITVPIQTIQNAVDYIRKCANPDGSIRYSLRSGHRQFHNQLWGGFDRAAFLGDVAASLANTSTTRH